MSQEAPITLDEALRWLEYQRKYVGYPYLLGH